MTAPARDSITIHENEHTIYSLPLELYWQQFGGKPPFFSLETGFDRGYVAKWLIEHNKLYLISFYGELLTDTGREEYSLSNLFPELEDKVFARWFTGEIIIPMGRPADYSNLQSFGVVYEYTTQLIFKEGILEDSGAFLL